MSAPSQIPQYQPRPRSIFGPLVLITLGVLFLLRSTGIVSFPAMHSWFIRYWPLLLIFWGAAKLLEHLWAVHRGGPTPRLGAGAIVFLVFFIMFGVGSWETKDWDPNGLRTVLGFDDWGGWFGKHYEFTEDFTQALPGASSIRVLCTHGDVTVTASADNQAHASIHKFLRADTQESANRLNDSIHPRFTQIGNVWQLDLTGGELERSRFELELQLPRTAGVSLTTRQGKLSVSQRTGDVELATRNGNASVEQLKGNVSLHLRHGAVTLKGVEGNVQLEGSVTDADISDVTGTLDFDAGYTGTVQLAHIAQPLHFKSIRTDLRLNKLQGELVMGNGDLRGNSLAGPVRLTTSSNEVHLEDVSGEITVENSNRVVEIRAKAPLGNIEINNVHSGIELDLPENAAFRLDAESRSGKIDASAFGLNVDNQRNDAAARGTVGKGGPDIRLRVDRGTIQLRKQ
jgi:DUF4097 and DUF4098 domain-containing protein YvlB